uniref:(northern house mosquito) hypothetical protein n=1 Tax=Culex pipiens TaxID=7175 RepID=A0A8D8A9I9_CULPI
MEDLHNSPNFASHSQLLDANLQTSRNSIDQHNSSNGQYQCIKLSPRMYIELRTFEPISSHHIAAFSSCQHFVPVAQHQPWPASSARSSPPRRCPRLRPRTTKPLWPIVRCTCPESSAWS